MADIEIRCMAT